MKYTEGRAANEIVEAAERLRDVVHHVGHGECLDAEKTLLSMAASTPRDHDLFVAVAAECAYRVETTTRRQTICRVCEAPFEYMSREVAAGVAKCPREGCEGVGVARRTR